MLPIREDILMNRLHEALPDNDQPVHDPRKDPYDPDHEARVLERVLRDLRNRPASIDLAKTR